MINRSWRRTAGLACAGLLTSIAVVGLNPRPAEAAGWNVEWESQSYRYAWGYAYSKAGCPSTGGTRTKMGYGGVSYKSGVQSIRSPNFYTEYSRDDTGAVIVIAGGSCKPVPATGQWRGYDPAKR